MMLPPRVYAFHEGHGSPRGDVREAPARAGLCSVVGVAGPAVAVLSYCGSLPLDGTSGSAALRFLGSSPDCLLYKGSLPLLSSLNRLSQ